MCNTFTGLLLANLFLLIKHFWYVYFESVLCTMETLDIKLAKTPFYIIFFFWKSRAFAKLKISNFSKLIRLLKKKKKLILNKNTD